MTLLDIAILRAKACKFQPPSERPQPRIESLPPPPPRPEPRPPVITLYEPDERPVEPPPAPKLPPRLTVEMIKNAVCAYFNVDMIDIISERRTRGIVRPRQIAMYLAKKNTTRSLPDIGRRFGGRDHTTALSAIRKVEQLIVDDDDIARSVSELQLILNSLIQPPQVEI